MDKSIFFEQLKSLQKSCYANSDDIKQLVANMVKTYKYPSATEDN
jgi:hypothetical protein